MNITFIIGNGFDLNLDLKTKYIDFYNYYFSIESEKKPIQDFKAYLNEKLKEEAKWSDLEVALGEYTANIGTEGDFVLIYDDVILRLKEYLQKQDNSFQVKDKEKFINDLIHFENYLSDVEKDSILNFRELYAQESHWYINIISFNYTSIIEKILECGKYDKYDNKSIQIGDNEYKQRVMLDNIYHIHGTLDSYMVLGVNDSTQIKNKAFKKNNDIKDKLIKPETNKQARKGIDEKCIDIIKDSHIICLYGTSVGDTDKMWWELIGSQLRDRDNLKVIYFEYGDEPEVQNIGPKRRELQDHLLCGIKLLKSKKDSKIFPKYTKEMFSKIPHNIISENNVTATNISEYDIEKAIRELKNRFIESIRMGNKVDSMCTSPHSDGNKEIFNPSSSTLFEYWRLLYVIIYSCNQLKDKHSDDENIAMAKAIEAIEYYQLTTFWGDVPYKSSSLTPPKVPIHEIHSSIETILNTTSLKNDVLSRKDIFLISDDVIKMVLANIYMYDKKYDMALPLLQGIENSGYYNIEETISYTNENKELIWALQDNMEIIPVCVYSDVMLSLAECEYMIGNEDRAKYYLDFLCNKKGIVVTNVDVLQSIKEIRYKCLANLSGYFAFLKRTGLARQELNINEYQLLLPIPQNEINLNPSLKQNNGY